MGEVEFYISGENLVDDDDKEIDNYFICVICTNVVDDPKECDQCERWYCAKCIDKWTVQHSKCPNCNVNFRAAKKASRFAYEKLKNLTFACEQCDKHLKYSEMKNHYTTQCMNVVCRTCDTPRDIAIIMQNLEMKVAMLQDTLRTQDYEDDYTESLLEQNEE